MLNDAHTFIIKDRCGSEKTVIIEFAKTEFGEDGLLHVVNCGIYTQDLATVGILREQEKIKRHGDMLGIRWATMKCFQLALFLSTLFSKIREKRGLVGKL